MHSHTMFCCATVAVLEVQYKAPKQNYVAAIEDGMGLSKLLIVLRNSGGWLARWQANQVSLCFYLHCEYMNTPNEWAKQAYNFKFWGARNQV